MGEEYYLPSWAKSLTIHEQWLSKLSLPIAITLLIVSNLLP